MSQVEGEADNIVQSISNQQRILIENGISGIQHFLTQHEFSIDNLRQLTDNEMKELLQEWSVPITLRMKTISVIRKLRNESNNSSDTAASTTKNLSTNTTVNGNTSIIVLSSFEYEAIDRLSQQQDNISSRIKEETSNRNNIRNKSKEIENKIDENIQKSIESIQQLSHTLKSQLKSIVLQKEKYIGCILSELENYQEMLNEANTKYQTIIGDFLMQAQNSGDNNNNNNNNNNNSGNLSLKLGFNIASPKAVKAREKEIVDMIDNVISNTSIFSVANSDDGNENNNDDEKTNNNNNNHNSNNNDSKDILFVFNFESLQKAINNCALVALINKKNHENSECIEFSDLCHTNNNINCHNHVISLDFKNHVKSSNLSLYQQMNANLLKTRYFVEFKRNQNGDGDGDEKKQELEDLESQWCRTGVIAVKTTATIPEMSLSERILLNKDNNMHIDFDCGEYNKLGKGDNGSTNKRIDLNNCEYLFRIVGELQINQQLMIKGISKSLKFGQTKSRLDLTFDSSINSGKNKYSNNNKTVEMGWDGAIVDHIIDTSRDEKHSYTKFEIVYKVKWQKKSVNVTVGVSSKKENCTSLKNYAQAHSFYFSLQSKTHASFVGTYAGTTQSSKKKPDILNHAKQDDMIKLELNLDTKILQVYWNETMVGSSVIAYTDDQWKNGLYPAVSGDRFGGSSTLSIVSARYHT